VNLDHSEDRSDAPPRSPFERWRRTVGLFLGPAVALLLIVLPMPNLSPEAHRLTAVVALVIIYWLTEAIPIPATALLGVSLAVVLGVAPVKTALASFGDPVIFLFVGSFIIARAMQTHGLDRRIAYSLLAHGWVGGSTHRTIWALGLTSWFLSMWMSNTACVAMLFPVALAIARATAEMIQPKESLGENTPRLRYTTGLLLMLAFSASIGGIATPVGSPPNLIGIGLIRDATQTQIGFLQWMMFGVPVAVALLVAAYGIILLMFRPEVRRVGGQMELMRQAKQQLGAWTAGQRNSLVAFGVAVVLWLAPGAVGLWLGAEHSLTKTLEAHLPEGVVALLAALLLFVLPTDWRRREFTMTWERAVKIDWGTVLLFGGGIALGKMIFDTKLATLIGDKLIAALGVQTPAALSGAGALMAVTVTETCSNTASANIVVPVMISMAQTLNIAALPPALAATMAVSMAFMLPISTPPNAIVYGSGAVKFTDMLKAGILLDLIGFFIVWAISVWWIPRVVMG
jgi:sodium-dependent dicarboxylate transporter 2/3/5